VKVMLLAAKFSLWWRIAEWIRAFEWPRGGVSKGTGMWRW